MEDSKPQYPILAILVYGVLALIIVLLVYSNSMGTGRGATIVHTFSMIDSIEVASQTQGGVTLADCQALLNDSFNQNTTLRTGSDILLQNMTKRSHVTVRKLIENTENCHRYVTRRGFSSVPTSETEAAFPVAYGISIHSVGVSFEQLLLAIYQPQNFYCVHVDNVETASTQFVVRQIARCFENVFIAENTSGFDELETELACTRSLFRRENWTYFVNVDDFMYPLKTNWEIVMILKALNRSSVIHVNRPERPIQQRQNQQVNPRVGAFVHQQDRRNTMLFMLLERQTLADVIREKTALAFLSLFKLDANSPRYLITIRENTANTSKYATDSTKSVLLPGYTWTLSDNTTGLIHHVPTVPEYSARCRNIADLFERHAIFSSMFTLSSGYREFYTCLACLHLTRTQEYIQYLRKFDVSFYQNLVST